MLRELFAAGENLVKNDWTENPNGENNIYDLRAKGRSDLLEWSRDVLAPKLHKAFEKYADEKGWGSSGSVDDLFSEADTG